MNNFDNLMNSIGEIELEGRNLGNVGKKNINSY